MCSSDALCRLHLDLDSVDYTTFAHVVRVHIINPNVQVLPVLQFAGMDVMGALENGTLCDDHRFRIMWLLLMRQTSICADHEYFDIQEGGCVCMEGKACKDLDGPEQESARWLGVVLFGVIGTLLYYMVMEVKMRRYMGVLMYELSVRHARLRDAIAGMHMDLAHLHTPTPLFDGEGKLLEMVDASMFKYTLS